MGIKIDSVNEETHNAIIKAMFGNTEGYLKSPALKEINNRIEYLEYLKHELNIKMEKEINQIKWWVLHKQVHKLTAKYITMPYVNNTITNLISGYSRHRGLPTRIGIFNLNIQFDKFMEDFQKPISILQIKAFQND